jgi:hypothetical protein
MGRREFLKTGLGGPPAEPDELSAGIQIESLDAVRTDAEG